MGGVDDIVGFTADSLARILRMWLSRRDPTPKFELIGGAHDLLGRIKRRRRQECLKNPELMAVRRSGVPANADVPFRVDLAGLAKELPSMPLRPARARRCGENDIHPGDDSRG